MRVAQVPTEIGAAYLLLVTLSVMCVMLTGREHGEVRGILMCSASVLMQSSQMSLSGRLMSSKLDAFQLNFYTGAPRYMFKTRNKHTHRAIPCSHVARQAHLTLHASSQAPSPSPR